MTRPAHPGTIHYHQGPEETLVRSVAVADVPEPLRYAQTPDGEVPVVKVVALTTAVGLELREYGPAGQLLRTTLSAPGR